MAEALVKAKYKEKFDAASAGFFPTYQPINEFALNALLSRGILPSEDNPFDTHKSKGIGDELIKWADKVIAVEISGANILKYTYPQYKDKITSFTPQIPDPYEKSEEEYRKTLSLIEEGLKKFIDD